MTVYVWLFTFNVYIPFFGLLSPQHLFFFFNVIFINRVLYFFLLISRTSFQGVYIWLHDIHAKFVSF